MNATLRLMCFATLLAGAISAEDAPKAKVETFSGKEEDFKGTVATKALDAKAGIVAIIKVTKDNQVEWVNLWASGDNAKKLDDLATKRGEVTVTGIRGADGIHVSKIGDDVKMPPSGKKKKK